MPAAPVSSRWAANTFGKSSKWNPTVARPGTEAPVATSSVGAGPAPWQPAEFDRPATPYPLSPYAEAPAGGRGGSGGGRAAYGGGGGGGGGWGGGLFSAYNPTASMGPGSYFPGDAGKFKQNMEMAMLNPNVAATYASSQPAAMAALMMHQARGTPGSAKWWKWQRGQGGGGAGGGSLAGGYQNAYDAARMENEARYRDINQGYQSRRDANQGAGAQERKDINDAWDREAARARQEMVSSGLSNSTVLQSNLARTEEDRRDNLGRLEAQLRREDADLTSDQLGFMERRTDAYPDYNQLAQLAEDMGQAGYNAAGGGGGGPVGGMIAPNMAGGGMAMGGWGGGGGYMAPGGMSAASAARLAANRNHWLGYNVARKPGAIGSSTNPMAMLMGYAGGYAPPGGGSTAGYSLGGSTNPMAMLNRITAPRPPGNYGIGRSTVQSTMLTGLAPGAGAEPFRPGAPEGMVWVPGWGYVDKR